jgi:hypothetical protein
MTQPTAPPDPDQRSPYRLIADLRLDHTKLRSDVDLLAQRTQMENAEMRAALTRLETGQAAAAAQRQLLSDHIAHGFEAVDRRQWQFLLAFLAAALAFASAALLSAMKLGAH